MKRRHTPQITASFYRISMLVVLLIFLSGSVWGQTTLAHWGLNNNYNVDNNNTTGTPTTNQSGLTFGNSTTPVCEGSHYVYCTGSNDYLQINIATTGYSLITISWQQRWSNTGTNRGSWTLSGDADNNGTYEYSQTNASVTGSCATITVTLPNTFDNKTAIRLRLTSNVTNGDYLLLDDIAISSALFPGSTITEIFNYTGATQTFTVPNCVSSITVEAWGGGGGGFDGDNGGGGKGGGGGAYAKKIINGVSGTYNIVVGAGGGEGNNGTASTFATNVVIADFGRGGTNQTTGGGAGGAGNASYDDYADGGNGGNGSGTGDVGGGGGGAGGPDGAGLQGSNGASGVGGNGGTGDNGSGGAGGAGGNGSDGDPGGNDPLRGGGGGGGGDNGDDGGNGGFPGGGGGGGEGNGGAGANGQVRITYTLPGIPTITLGSNPSVPVGTTTANLAYTATTGCPDKYSIDWDGTAQGQGFADVTGATLGASPIVLAVPGGAAPATYNGTLTVTNSTYGFVSSTYNIQVTVTGGTCVLTFTTGPGNTNISCYGGSDGQIIVTITSADNSPYTFSIDDGTNYNVSFTGSYPNYTLTGLAAGAHKIRIKDKNGCESASCL